MKRNYQRPQVTIEQFQEENIIMVSGAAWKFWDYIPEQDKKNYKLDEAFTDGVKWEW